MDVRRQLKNADRRRYKLKRRKKRKKGPRGTGMGKAAIGGANGRKKTAEKRGQAQV